MKPSRRELLQGAGGGLALLSLPRFVAGCARTEAPLAAAGPIPANPFLAWFSVDDATLRAVLTELGARGADQAELYFQHTRSCAITLEDGLVNRATTSIEQGVGLRVVIGDQVGYAFTEELTLDAMLAAARTASSIASGTAVVPPVALALASEGGLYRLQVPWSDVGVDERLPILRGAEQAARAKSTELTKVSVQWTDSQEKVMIATLDGRILVDDRPMSRLWVNTTAKRGEAVQAGSSNLAGRHGLDWYTPAQLELVAQQAVDRTLILFDAVRPKAGEMPVVLASGASGILLHEAIGHGMEADFNRKDISIYSTMLGQKIAPDSVTIVDDGTQAGERGSLNVDDEGTPCERTVLVRNGVLETYLHDAQSARHYGLAKSTGSGRRESFRSPPMPRMRSTYMESGPSSRDEIVASVENGIVAETFTNGEVQIGAGDFTFYIKSGWLIEKGKITAPIKDVNIIGNGPDALKKVTMVGNDARLDTGGWTCGKNGQSVPVSQGLPTVLVSSLTVGGRHG